MLNLGFAKLHKNLTGDLMRFHEVEFVHVTKNQHVATLSNPVLGSKRKVNCNVVFFPIDR
jgi:hypothetical protein